MDDIRSGYLLLHLYIYMVYVSKCMVLSLLIWYHIPILHSVHVYVDGNMGPTYTL